MASMIVVSVPGLAAAPPTAATGARKIQSQHRQKEVRRVEQASAVRAASTSTPTRESSASEQEQAARMNAGSLIESHSSGYSASTTFREKR